MQQSTHGFVKHFVFQSHKMIIGAELTEQRLVVLRNPGARARFLLGAARTARVAIKGHVCGARHAPTSAAHACAWRSGDAAGYSLIRLRGSLSMPQDRRSRAVAMCAWREDPAAACRARSRAFWLSAVSSAVGHRTPAVYGPLSVLTIMTDRDSTWPLHTVALPSPTLLTSH